MQLFTDWANKENKTIIFVHHSTKHTTKSRGASAFVDAVRTVYEIDKIKDKDGNIQEKEKRIIKLTKDNYGISSILGSFEIKRTLFPKIYKDQQKQNKKAIEYIYEENTDDMPKDF
jgi:replicative DNA helicase